MSTAVNVVNQTPLRLFLVPRGSNAAGAALSFIGTSVQVEPNATAVLQVPSASPLPAAGSFQLEVRNFLGTPNCKISVAVGAPLPNTITVTRSGETIVAS